MKKVCTILLHEGTDQHQFVDEISHEDCYCIDHCENIQDVVVLSLLESEIETLKSHPSVKNLTVEPTPHPADLSAVFSSTKTFTGTLPGFSQDGRNYGPLQFYYLNDSIKSPGVKVGVHRWTGNPPPVNDNVTSINGTYVSPWLGEHVDIVSLEVQKPTFNNYHNTHPDFKKVSDPTSSKFIPTNWTGLSSTINTQQLSTSSILSSHAIGVLSAAAGTYCGYAKKANLRVIYYDDAGIVPTINRVISWHNSKPVNPTTGEKNPTILIHEYQYLANNSFCFKIDDISSINYYDKATNSTITVNRPGTSWGTDFTPFVSNNFNVKRVILNGTYFWVVIIPPAAFIELFAAINSASSAGILNLVAAGNDCGVYVKETDPANTNTTIRVRAGAQMIYNSLDVTFKLQPTIFTTLATTSTFSALTPYGPNGTSTGIDVAAGQNSETHPILDHYSVRGPGIDIVGLGASTWTSYPGISFADGNPWGMFSGTSCATPTVAGILACILEKYRYYYGTWPTQQQAKELLFAEAKKGILATTTATTWATTPNPSTVIPGREISAGPVNLMLIYKNVNANGGISSNELLGTTNRRAFIDNSVSKHNLNRTSRPASGMVYPRNKIKIG